MKPFILFISLLLILTNCSLIKHSDYYKLENRPYYISNWSIGSLATVDRDSDLLADSLTKKIILAKKKYRDFPLSQLDDTVLALIKAVSPRLKFFNPKHKILSWCKLSKTDTIAVFFDHSYKENNLEHQERIGYRGNYFWETSDNDSQILYDCNGDSIRIIPHPEFCMKGTGYNSFSKKAESFSNIRRGKDNRASESMCGLQIAVKNEMVQSIEGWYYY